MQPAPESSLYLPMGHVLLLALVAVEKVPRSHALHEVWPLEEEYLPGSHAVQLVAAPDCDDAFLPAGQGWQVLLLLALVAAEKVPLPHGVHEVWRLEDQ